MEKNGYYQKTIYGRKWVSYKSENNENMWIVVIGLFATVIFLICN